MPSSTKVKLTPKMKSIIHRRNVMLGPISIGQTRMVMHQKVGLKSRTKATSKLEWTKILKYSLDSGSMKTIKLTKKLMVMVMQKL